VPAAAYTHQRPGRGIAGQGGWSAERFDENNTEAASFFDDPIYGYFETKTKPEGPNTKITLIKLEDPKTNN